MIQTLNFNRQATSILENAYGIGYKKVSNQIWSASFSLPLNDPKNEEVKLLQYVEIEDDSNGEYIGLFRIIPKLTTKNESTQSITYQCEHVLATLLDSSLFKYHQLSNYTTTVVLQYLMDRQKVKHWKLGKVDFTRYFHYSWENENLLSALFSVPKPFDEQFRWTWDTQSYPWTLNLVRPETEPTCCIKEGYNLRGLEIEENPMGVFNRIYPLGVGEGVNQLGIESVNGGVPYVEDTASIQKYGLKEYIWVDQRFENAATLKASAEALLKKWKEPVVTWNISAAELSSITGEDVDKLKEGKVVRLELNDYPVTDLRIMSEDKKDITGNPGDVQLEIGNLSEDLGTTQADLERRQKINELYSQGATNIDSRDFQDNCDPNFPAVIRFPIPDDVVNINEMSLTFETQKFRAYERAIKGGGAVVSSTSAGGAVVKSTSSGGGNTATSSSGGGVAKSTASGGGSTATTETRIFARLKIESGASKGGTVDTHRHDVDIDGDFFSHSHNVPIPAHSHSFDIPNHSHSVTIPAHTHDIDIPAHTHDITLPNHTHDIEYGIFEYSELPNEITITVDGNVLPVTATSGERIDLLPFLQKDTSGRIERGRYAEIKLTPDTLARINATVTSRLFIQSRIGTVM